MPEMDGLMATALIREHLKDIPILAMTAQAMEAERQICFAAGMNDHISKPFDPDDLLQRLNKWLRVSRGSALLAVAPLDAPGEEIKQAPLIARFKSDAHKVGLLLETMRRDLMNSKASLRQGVLTHDPALAGRIAHSLKGMAGIVPAPELPLAAMTLSQAVGDGSDWVEAANAMIRVIEAVLHTLPAMDGNSAQDAAPDGTEAELPALFQELSRQLQRQSLSARSTVKALRRQIQGEPAVDRLETAVRSLDFNAALEILAELAEAQGVSLTSASPVPATKK